MPSEFRVRVESHPNAAIVYLSGPVTSDLARDALRVCERLTADVHLLRVDLTAARLSDPGPIGALAFLLHRWRRGGIGRRTRLDLPPVHRRPRPSPLPRRAASRPPRPAARV